MKSTGRSSAKFGPCEVCGKHASEVWMKKIGVADYVFGHKECLEGDDGEILNLAAKFREEYHRP